MGKCHKFVLTRDFSCIVKSGVVTNLSKIFLFATPPSKISFYGMYSVFATHPSKQICDTSKCK